MKKKMTEILFNTLEGKLNKEQIFQLIEIPPDEKFGDFALPCFSLAKSYRRNPQEIAAKLADSIVKHREIHKAQAISGYLNLFVDRHWMTQTVLTEVLDSEYGHGRNNETSVLVQAFRKIIGDCLDLLGIEKLEEM